MLTKEQMKKINGGYVGCHEYFKSGNPPAFFQANADVCSDDCSCQTFYDGACEWLNISAGVDCGCK